MPVADASSDNGNLLSQLTHKCMGQLHFEWTALFFLSKIKQNS